MNIRQLFARCVLMNCLLLAITLQGCSRPKTPPPPATGMALVEALKTGLKGVIESGEGGSGLDSLNTQVELLQNENPEAAASIKPDVTALLRASSPERRKELAKKILDKLSA